MATRILSRSIITTKECLSSVFSRSYIKTLAKVIGSEEEARMKIYSVSTRHYFAFGALVSEELSYMLKELEHVRWVLPDSYLDVKNKDYGEMRKIFGGRDVWVVGLSNRFRRPFSSTSNPNNNDNKVVDGSLNQYRDLDKLDFMTASKILFSTPPKKKKFGIDFHLVQLFFACMPSLAVYLVAQYARYEMRRMEAELEEKKKAEEEAKAKEMELKASEEKESGSNAELKEVQARLGKLEEAVKEIVVEGSKKQLGSSIPQKQEDGNGKKQSAATTAEEQTSKGRTKGSGQQERSGSAPAT